MNRAIILSTALAALALVGCTQPPPAPRTAPHVDLSQYAGTWYEIARLPLWFEQDATAVEARYFPRGDGTIEVLNLARQHAPDGPLTVAHGLARVVDADSNAKLKVRFGFIEGDYWILRLDPAYRWAVVGSPDRKALWILARDRRLDDATYARLLEEMRAEGFPVDRLERTRQP